jgi:hypothetical protein
LRRRGDSETNLIAATGAAAAYWVALGLSILFRGTAYLDPESDRPNHYVLGLPGNLFAAIAMLVIVFLAAYLGFTHRDPPQVAQERGPGFREGSLRS